MRRPVAGLTWFVAGIVVVALLLEFLLAWLPVNTGMPRTKDYPRWPLQNTDPHMPYSYSITWAMRNAHRGVTNNYGHVAPFDYRKNSHPIVVIGDSFIESLMNKYEDTLQGQLGHLIGAPERVYGLGVSGLSASDYVALTRLARDEFRPAAAVYVLVDGDLSESLLEQRGSYFLVPDGKGLALHYDPIRPDPDKSRLKSALADSAIHRYFQINLQFSLDPLWKKFHLDGPAPPSSPNRAAALDAQRKVADWFLSEVPTGLDLPPRCVVLLLDSDRYAIYNPALPSPKKDDPAVRAYFIERASQLGFQVVDLGPIFADSYSRDNVKFDYWPIDRHWNRVGHGIAAREAYRHLFGPGGLPTRECPLEGRSAASK